MRKEPRFLISTADERTWKFDRPVVFLGEWCRTYNRKHIWQNMDAVVCPPYGLAPSQRSADHVEARMLEEKLFGVLCDSLNSFHDAQHNTRFWRILLGHWFRRYVEVMLNRVRSLELCIQSHNLSGTAAFRNVNYSLSPQDSLDAIYAFNSDRWNHELTIRLLQLLTGPDLCIEELEELEEHSLKGQAQIESSLPQPFLRRILKWGYRIVKRAANSMSRDNDAFIVNSYLPKASELQLNFALKQFPQLWNSPRERILTEPDTKLREKLKREMAYESENKLERILSEMVFELMPVCYLEGLNELGTSVRRRPWPRTPRFIFTSNNFDKDETFKLWTAIKTEAGSIYIVGQHGNNYGTDRFMNPSIEEITADKFLTWGWADGLSQHQPAFILKMAGKRTAQYNKRGGLLLIELHLNHRITTWDGTFEFAEYFKDQLLFASQLDCKPKQSLTVRLHSQSRRLTWYEEARWHVFDPTIKIDQGAISIDRLIADSRLIVHSYDSTGILETLSLNIPTLAYWQHGFEHLRESSKPYYQLLVDAGIVHFSADSIARQVNEVWDDVETWWQQNLVQEARRRFCEQYGKISLTPIKDLEAIIRC
jgi:putative transferase (TIGR04331 family)